MPACKLVGMGVSLGMYEELALFWGILEKQWPWELLHNYEDSSFPVCLQPFTTTKGLTVAVTQDKAAMTTSGQE